LAQAILAQAFLRYRDVAARPLAVMSGATVFVGALWIGTSAVFSTYANGLFLNTFKDPYAHTFLRFALSSSIGVAYSAAAARSLLVQLPRLAARLFVPSVLLLSANLLNSVSMQLSGVTLTYVVKSLIPFFTVILCRIRGQRFSIAVYASLVPICAGVSIASATDFDFTGIGLLCALGSSLSQTLLNVTSKERIQDLQLSGMQAFFVMATVCANLSAPLLLLSYAKADGFLQSCVALVHGSDPLVATELSRTLFHVSLMAATAYHIEYTLNFLFISFCGPLAFSVTDIVRRLATIICGSLLFSKPLSLMNAFGVLIALLGVVSYSIVTKRGGAVSQCNSSAPSLKAHATRQGGGKGPEQPWFAHYGALASMGAHVDAALPFVAARRRRY